jgi:hypothetical protein
LPSASSAQDKVAQDDQKSRFFFWTCVFTVSLLCSDMSRRTTIKPETLVNFRAHPSLVRSAKEAARRIDLDLSKFIRTAIREKARRHGVPIENN